MRDSTRTQVSAVQSSGSLFLQTITDVGRHVRVSAGGRWDEGTCGGARGDELFDEVETLFDRTSHRRGSFTGHYRRNPENTFGGNCIGLDRLPYRYKSDRIGNCRLEGPAGEALHSHTDAPFVVTEVEVEERGAPFGLRGNLTEPGPYLFGQSGEGFQRFESEGNDQAVILIGQADRCLQCGVQQRGVQTEGS